MNEGTMEKARQVVHRLSEWYFAEGVDNDPDSPIDREDLHALHELVRTAETIAMIAGEPVPVDTGFWSATPEPGGEGEADDMPSDTEMLDWIGQRTWNQWAHIAPWLGKGHPIRYVVTTLMEAERSGSIPNLAALRSEVQGEEEALVQEILAELGRAREKFRGYNVTALAMVEEVGELAKALIDESRERVREEAVQVAAMAMRVVLDGDQTLDAWRESKGLDPLTAARRGEGGGE